MASKSPRFEVYRDSLLFWRWRLKAANGRKIASCGEGYFRRRDMEAALEIVNGGRFPVVELGGGK